MLREWLDHREKPSLILHGRGKTNVRTQPVVSANAKIGYCAAPRDKNLADFLMPEIELNPISRREPIVAPSLGTLPTPANPASDDIAVVCVAASPSGVEIEIARSDRATTRRYIGVNPSTRRSSLLSQGKWERKSPACHADRSA